MAGLLRRQPNTVFYENPRVPGATHVTVDRVEAGRLAVRHLAEKGRRRIAFALMTLSRATHLARRQGYEAELAAQNLPLDPHLVFNGEPHGLCFAKYNRATHQWDFPAHVIDLAIEALVREQHADAIVAHDDFWAAALLRGLKARGIRVPDDVAVVGYLNHYLADWTDPSLTTIDLQHAVAAQAMVGMLERIITQGPLPEDERVVKIQPTLIVRSSA
jgi:DNA-binding LacI/PurR family transcriptional regulator